MTKSLFAVGVGALLLTACEPTFVEVTFDGLPKCETNKLSTEIVVKIDGPRSSSMHRARGDGEPMTAKLVVGKLYKVKAYKCASDPCETEKNLFHGDELTAPEGKTARMTLALPGAPACVPPEPPPAPAPAPAEDAGVAAPAAADAG